MEQRDGNARSKTGWQRFSGRAMLIAAILLLVAILAIGPLHKAPAAGTTTWPTYLANNAHTAFNGAETVINPTTAPNLKLLWVHKLKSYTNRITTQPIVANGMVYWGSWDGLEHASRLSDGTDVWTANLGQTLDCRGGNLGVLSSATIATVTIGGTQQTVDFVGGGDSNLYALDANTGAVLWHTQLGNPPNSFLYSSPTVFNGSVYIGVSGNDDCQRTQGQLVQVNGSTGAIQNTFDVVPAGCVGASVWTSPTINESTGILYFSTAEKSTCSQPETMATSLIALNASNLSFVGSWKVPKAQQITDGDFGASPTLFQATIGGGVHQMVGLDNKSGIYYAFDQSNISAGPLWQVRLATAPGPSTSSSAWDGQYLYVAAGPITANNTTCPGNLWALNPADGSARWHTCLSWDARGGITVVPGVIEVPTGTYISVFDASNGNLLFSYQDSGKRSNFEGPGTIVNGVLYQGNNDGKLYAFAP
jgi:polyvinyl alcohol dehydrogenase (cytochrome)